MTNAVLTVLILSGLVAFLHAIPSPDEEEGTVGDGPEEETYEKEDDEAATSDRDKRGILAGYHHGIILPSYGVNHGHYGGGVALAQAAAHQAKAARNAQHAAAHQAASKVKSVLAAQATHAAHQAQAAVAAAQYQAAHLAHEAKQAQAAAYAAQHYGGYGAHHAAHHAQHAAHLANQAQQDLHAAQVASNKATYAASRAEASALAHRYDGYGHAHIGYF